MDEYVLNTEDEGMKYVLKQQMIITYNQLTEEGELQRANLDKELVEANQRLERLEERYNHGRDH